MQEETYQKAAAFSPPFPPRVVDVLLVISGVYSAYGSGYFFYWILNITGGENQGFDLANPMWWIGMVIGLLISVDIYTGAFNAGQYFAHIKLYQNDKEEKKEIYEIFERFGKFLAGIRIFARMTTVIGFACLFYGKIDFQMQDVSVKQTIIQAKQAELDSLNMPIVPLDKLPEYRNQERLLNNGTPEDDAGAHLAKQRIIEEYYARIAKREKRREVLRAEIENLQINSLKVNNLAWFEWAADILRISGITAMILAVMVAALVLDQVFSRLGRIRGEIRVNESVKMAFQQKPHAPPQVVDHQPQYSFLSSTGDKIAQIRKRWKEGDETIVSIVNYLNNTDLPHKKIGMLHGCSDTWVGYVQKMLREEGENVRP